MTPQDVSRAQLIETQAGVRLYHQGWRPQHPMADQLTTTTKSGEAAYETDPGGWHCLAFSPNGHGHWWRHSVLLKHLVVRPFLKDVA